MKSQREEWLRERQKGIGGSDAASVLGLDPRRSRYALWVEKTQPLVIENDQPEAPWLEWGHRLEGVIIKKFNEKTGKDVRPYDSFKIIRYDYAHFAHASIDAWDYPPPETFILECKTASTFKSPEWKDGPPLNYQIQLQHYLAVLGLDEGAIAVLIGGQNYQHWMIERNEEFTSLLMEEEEAFWHLVETDIPPEVDGSRATAEAITRLYPVEQATSKPVIFPVTALLWSDEIDEINKEMRELKERHKELTNRLKVEIGESESGALPKGAGQWTWLTQNRKAVESTSYRVLKRKRGKK